MAAVYNRNELIDLIKRYSEILRNSMQVDQIYLFGSYATGKADADSDIDLLIVSPDFTDDFVQNQLILMRARREIDYRIEPHPVLTKDLDSNILFTIAKKEMLRLI